MIVVIGDVNLVIVIVVIEGAYSSYSDSGDRASLV